MATQLPNIDLTQLRVRGDTSQAYGEGGRYAGDGKPTVAAAKDQLLRMVAAGISFADCAKALGRSYQSVMVWSKEPQFLERLKELNLEMYQEIDAQLKLAAKTTRERIELAANEALDKVIDLMRGADSEVIQFRAAQDLMDRNQPTSKIHRVDKREVKVNISAEWLQNAALVEAEDGEVING